MALRGRISGSGSDGRERCEYKDPVLGINLYKANQDLMQGEAVIMQNCIIEGGLRGRNGSTRVNGTSLGAYRIRGGHKYYYGAGSPTSKRLIAYDTRISVLSDAGTPTSLTTGMTADLETYFATWPITDSVYISNNTDTLRKYDGTTFSTVSGTAIPAARGPVVPVLDRMMAVTVNGIERTNPRSDSVWSNNSSWATLRPIKPGLFTVLHPFTVRGTDTLYPGALAFQSNAYYLVSGTDFGDDVTNASASTGENGSIQLLDPNVGTASPKSVCTVPGVGIFWFTTDLNVYFLPEGSLTGRYVGDKIQATGDIAGCDSTNTAALNQVWMAYHDRKLYLGIPTGTDTFATKQFWMDIRAFLITNGEPVWYGPMDGQSVGCVWVENANGDNAIYGGEGNSAVGAFTYRLDVPNVYSDAVGLADHDITGVYQSMYEDFGIPSRQKYLRGVHMDISQDEAVASVDVYDLPGIIAQNIPLQAVSD